MSRVKFDTSSIPDWATLTDWARLEILQNTVSELYEDRDAQRLRADTAEADSIRKDGAIEDLMQSNGDMTTCLAAAEQSIAELRDLLARFRADSDLWFKEFGEPSDGKYSAAFTEIDALNPNPEAESHE